MQCNIFIYFLIIFLSLSHLSSEEKDFRLDGQAEPSSYIHGCVNAITGSFAYSFQDIVVEGPEPISFIRHYCSNNTKKRNFGMGFSHNHATETTKVGSVFPYETLAIEESGGDRLHFTAQRDKKAEEHWFYLDPKQLRHGYTNCSGGAISGRTNPKNTKLYVSGEDFDKLSSGKCTAYLGDGTRRFYRKDSLLSYEVRPCGNIVRYVYHKDKKIARIYATDPTGQTTLGWMNFTYDKKKHTVNVVASNGKEGSYRVKKKKLESFIVTGQPKCSVEYTTTHVGEGSKNNIKKRVVNGIDWGGKGKHRIGLPAQ